MLKPKGGSARGCEPVRRRRKGNNSFSKEKQHLRKRKHSQVYQQFCKEQSRKRKWGPKSQSPLVLSYLPHLWAKGFHPSMLLSVLVQMTFSVRSSVWLRNRLQVQGESHLFHWLHMTVIRDSVKLHSEIKTNIMGRGAHPPVAHLPAHCRPCRSPQKEKALNWWVIVWDATEPKREARFNSLYPRRSMQEWEMGSPLLCQCPPSHPIKTPLDLNELYQNQILYQQYFLRTNYVLGTVLELQF